jgi:hypothetical protein
VTIRPAILAALALAAAPAAASAHPLTMRSARIAIDEAIWSDVLALTFGTGTNTSLTTAGPTRCTRLSPRRIRCAYSIDTRDHGRLLSRSRGVAIITRHRTRTRVRLLPSIARRSGLKP